MLCFLWSENDRYYILSVLADILPKSIYKKQGLTFSISKYITFKRKYIKIETEDIGVLKITKRIMKSKKN